MVTVNILSRVGHIVGVYHKRENAIDLLNRMASMAGVSLVTIDPCGVYSIEGTEYVIGSYLMDDYDNVS